MVWTKDGWLPGLDPRIQDVVLVAPNFISKADEELFCGDFYTGTRKLVPCRPSILVARALRRPIVTIAGTQVSYSENAGVLFARKQKSGQSFYEIRQLTR